MLRARHRDRDGRAAGKLIGPPPPPGAGGLAAWRLPERYGVTEAGLLLRGCRHFGLDPIRAMERPEWEQHALMAAGLLLDAEEEARWSRAMRAISAALGAR